jgi:4-amino-4-deoxy-L-arabinose transferase-like glycosyltransferase
MRCGLRYFTLRSGLSHANRYHSEREGFTQQARRLSLWGLAMALWLLAFAWIRPLSDPDEGRYAVVALDMLRTGNWVTPHLNGLPFFHKPPLYYWLAAGGYECSVCMHGWRACRPCWEHGWHR